MTTYKKYREGCSVSPKFDDDKCILAASMGTPCNGYKCPLVHFYRGTRPSKILESYGLGEQYAEDMG